MPTLSVMDNMSLGSGFPTAFGTIRGKESAEAGQGGPGAAQPGHRPAGAGVGTLSASEKTGVAIARALREDPDYPARLLVLDEPTATLPVDEVDHLLDRVSAISATGVGVLYVTHHLGEVFRVAQQGVGVPRRQGRRRGPGRGLRPRGDRPAARRRGAAGGGVRDAPREGRARRGSATRETVLEIEDLHAGALAGVTIEVKRGEIVGVAGLAGSGRDSVLGASFGALPRAAGAVKVAGKPLPGDAARPGDRAGRGLRRAGPQDRRRRS